MKKHLTIFLFINILSLFGYGLKSQSISKSSIDLSEAYKSGMPRIIPPSPQSQIFEKFVNYPVTEYNGLVDISIPLYEIKLKDMTIPITLSYHSGGIRHSANADFMRDGSDGMSGDGDVGAGWSINATGFRIIRTIRGKPDGDFSMYNSSSLQSLIEKGDKKALDRYLAGLYYKTVPPSMFNNPTLQDSEYDMYTYILPTGSAHFIYGSDNKLRIIEKKNDKISWGTNNTASIRDDAGNLYSFGGNDKKGKALVEKIVWDQEYFKEANTAWGLSQIETPYKEKISFEYQEYVTPTTHSVGFQINEAYYHHPYGNTVLTNEAMLRPTRILNPTLDHKYTELIVSKIETDNEIITINRKSNSKIIEDITVTDKKGNILNKIKLSYNTPSTSNWHRLLTSVKLTNGNQTEKEYSLDYYDPPLDNLNTCVYDQWGFYKKSTIVSNPTNSGHPYQKAFLHSEFADVSILNKVNSKKESGPNIPPLQPEVETYEYKKIKDAMGLMSSKDDMLNRLENSNPHFFSLKSITIPTGAKTQFIYEPNMFYKHIGSKALISGGGQRIKTIKTYRDNNDNYPLTIDYKYGVNEDGIGKANMDVDYKAFYTTSISLSKFTFARGDSSLPLIGTRYNASKTFYIESPFVNMNDFSVSYEFVSSIKSTYVNTNQGKKNRYQGKIVSQYIVPDQYSLNPILGVNIGSSTISLFRHSLSFYGSYLDKVKPGYKPLLKERKTYDSNNFLVLKENYTYETTSNNEIIEGLKLDQKIQFSSDYNLETTGELLNVHSYSNPVIGYVTTRLETGTDLPKSKSTVMFSGSDSLKTIETYGYDGNHRLKTSSSTFNNDDSLTKELIYPTNTREPDLVGLNIVGKPVETITKRNQKEIGRIKYTYNKSIYPTSILSSASGDQNLRSDITFDKYDSRGNILQTTNLKGLKTTYLWSYNKRYPIAEINNASLAEVEKLLNTTAEKITELEEPDMTKLGQLQKDMPQAHVSLYTYKPFYGMSSAINPSGIATYYEYDKFRYLSNVKDYDKAKIVEYFYSYNNGKDVSEENESLKTELYTPLKIDLPTQKTYPVNKKFGVFSVLVEGGSLQYSYDWILKQKSGKVIKQELNSKSYNFDVGKVFDQGDAELTCSVKDIITGKVNSVVKDIKFILIPMENLTIYSNKDEYITSNSYSFSCSLDGGSGQFIYDWYLYNRDMTKVIESKLGNTTTDVSFYISTVGDLQLLSVVKDKTTSATINRVKSLVVVNNTPVGFGTVTTSYNTASSTISGGQYVSGATAVIEINAYAMAGPWGATSSASFSLGNTTKILYKPGKETITMPISNGQKVQVVLNPDPNNTKPINASITIKSITPSYYKLGSNTISISK